MKKLNILATVCALVGVTLLGIAGVLSHQTKQRSARAASLAEASEAWSEAVDPLLEHGHLFDLMDAINSSSPPEVDPSLSADELRIIEVWNRRREAAIVRAQQRLDAVSTKAAEVLLRAVRDADSKGRPAWPSKEQGLTGREA